MVESQTLNNILLTWLIKAVSIWETDLVPTPPLLTLAINFSIYISADENYFIQLNNQDIFQRFIKLIKKALNAMEATPNIGYVRLMSAFLNHKSGCRWIISSSYWSEIVLLTLSSPNDSDLTQVGYKFTSKLIAKSNSTDSEFCRKVINLMIAPIIDIANSPEHIFDSSIIRNRESTFNFVTAVLDNLLEERRIIMLECVLEVLNQTKLELHLGNLLKKIKDESLTVPIIILLHLISMYKLIVDQNKYASSYINYDDFRKISSDVIEFVTNVMKTGFPQIILQICANEHRYFEKLGPLVPKIKTRDNIITSISEQLVIFELYACCYVGNTLFGTDYCNIEDSIRDNAITTRIKRMLPETIRFVYLLKDMYTVNFTLEYATISLKYFLSRTHEVVDKESRIMSLQYLITCLEDISIAIRCKPEELLKLPGKDTYILTLMQTITILLKEFDLNWQDIFETMLLLDITNTILEFQSWEKEVST